jgi:hypothetical protein
LGQKWWHNHAPFVVQLLRRRQRQPSSLFPHKVNLFVSPNCLPKFSWWQSCRSLIELWRTEIDVSKFSKIAFILTSVTYAQNCASQLNLNLTYLSWLQFTQSKLMLWKAWRNFFCSMLIRSFIQPTPAIKHQPKTTNNRILVYTLVYLTLCTLVCSSLDDTHRCTLSYLTLCTFDRNPTKTLKSGRDSVSPMTHGSNFWR